MGKVMGAVKTQLAGKADMALVSQGQSGPGQLVTLTSAKPPRYALLSVRELLTSASPFVLLAIALLTLAYLWLNWYRHDR